MNHLSLKNRDKSFLKTLLFILKAVSYLFNLYVGIPSFLIKTYTRLALISLQAPHTGNLHISSSTIQQLTSYLFKPYIGVVLIFLQALYGGTLHISSRDRNGANFLLAASPRPEKTSHRPDSLRAESLFCFPPRLNSKKNFTRPASPRSEFHLCSPPRPDFRGYIYFSKI